MLLHAQPVYGVFKLPLVLAEYPVIIAAFIKANLRLLALISNVFFMLRGLVLSHQVKYALRKHFIPAVQLNVQVYEV